MKISTKFLYYWKKYDTLSDEQKKEMIELFNEFEEGKTPEAKFAKTMDDFQPILLNDSNNGRPESASDKKSQLGSKDIWEYTS